MKKAIIGVILAVTPMICTADEVSEIYHQRAKTFVATHPIINKQADAKVLVEMWSRIEGIKNLIDLYFTDRALFKLPGKDALRPWMINKRITSHLLNLKIMYKNDMAGALRDLIQLHAQFAREVMDGKVKKYQYDYVADAVISAGQDIAELLKK